MRIRIPTIVAAFCWPVAAWAAPAVYPGCPTYTATAGHHTFHVDPVQGSMDGDGSAARPWRTLAEVLDPSRKLLTSQGGGPIKPGDTLELMSGDHGAVTIANALNNDFVVVKAAAKQTPVISRLTMRNAAKWAFEGIKFQGENTAPRPDKIVHRDTASMVMIGQNEKPSTSTDIVFDRDSFSTADNTAGWSDEDWILKPYFYSIENSASCVTVSNSRFTAIFNALGITGPKFFFQNNLIEGFANDGVDLVASDVILRGNTIKGGVSSKTNPWHPDGIQGWSKITAGVPATNSNVMIDGNWVEKTGDPNVSFMQGITVFDGKWDGLTIQNNVVITNHWHGIAVYGADHLRIINNTVVASEPVNHATWIRVNPAKDGRASQDAVVRNNVSPTLMIQDEGVTLDHNATGRAYGVMRMGQMVAVKQTDRTDHNMVLTNFDAQFANVDTAAARFDLSLRPISPLLEAGSTELAPKTDITGAARGASVSIGAYQR